MLGPQEVRRLRRLVERGADGRATTAQKRELREFLGASSDKVWELDWDGVQEVGRFVLRINEGVAFEAA